MNNLQQEQGELKMEYRLSRGHWIQIVMWAVIILSMAYQLLSPTRRLAPTEEVLSMIVESQTHPEVRELLFTKFREGGNLNLTLADVKELKPKIEELITKDGEKVEAMKTGLLKIDLEYRASACKGLFIGYSAQKLAIPKVLLSNCLAVE